ncbi:MAG: LuxR C-terminal-related transcriptional regulator, partial [Candidatus Promineifilaceae bacterium]
MGTQGQIEFEPLTDREREIIGLIAAGLSNQQIADQLFLTLGTVKWYNKQTFQKLDVHSRTQAVLRARELGFLGRAIPAPQPNFPAQHTVFIGRESELAEIQARLCDPACRLLTLVGPGGIGKTRLAMEAARRQIDAFPDGTIFMSFAPIDTAGLISQTMAEGLGLTHSSQHDPQDQVIRYLRAKTLLLVIDNFEHLLSGVDLLAKILGGCMKVKMLVTSRERLHLRQEWVFDVPGLNFPVVQSAAQEPLDMAEYEAGQLFLQTAVRVQSDFAPDQSDQLHIARICQSLEGMPLGIELAASWVRLLPCAEIAQEITRGLDILTTSWRDIPERHRSLRAVLDHSWQLLEHDERDAFRKLTVFKGNFRRDAAQAVAGVSLVMLLALMDKSFLQPARDDRFAIHELLKQYGSAKLKANPEIWAAARLHHCRYYASFLNQLMRSPQAYVHLREVEEVLDELKAAWHFAVENIHLAEIQLLA